MRIEGRMFTSRRHGPAWLAVAFVLVLVGCGPNRTAEPTTLPASQAARGDEHRLLAHLEALQAIATAHGGVRTAGTAGYEASVDYVAAQLRDLGYAVETPEFEMATFAEEPGATIQVGGGGPIFRGGPDFHAMIYSASGEISAPVVAVGFADGESGGCDTADFAEFPRGAIALAPPGPCYRRQVVLHAVDAGAAALVVGYPQWPTGEVRRPTLLAPEGIEIPALSASDVVGAALRAAADSETQVRISLRTEIAHAQVRNVIAESRAVAERVVMLGGHLDSVHDGPGINDNGSGTAALLEVARQLAEQHPTVRVRLAFWGGEELGLLGSQAYVDTLFPDARAEIAAYLNFDMVGSPNFVPFVYDAPGAAPGSDAITDFLAAYLEDVGFGAERKDIGASSDHVSFDAAAIPTGGIFSGANEVKSAAQMSAYGGTADAPMDACYHLACDTAENVDLRIVSILAGAAMAATLAIATGDLSLR